MTSSAVRLKRIIHPQDTISCPGCIRVISQRQEHFTYDIYNRLTTRIVTTHTSDLAQTATSVDTTERFLYNYQGTSSRITGYSHIRYAAPINHLLSYDASGRLVADTILNETANNNKSVRYFYSGDTILATYRYKYFSSDELVFDTMIVSNNNVVKQNIGIEYLNPPSKTYVKTIYTLSSLRNPLSYVNNHSLLGSDYKITDAFSETLFHGQQNIPLNASHTYIYGSSQFTRHMNYTLTTDLMNRVTEIISDLGNNRKMKFEYY
jgi:hypothetical protein